MIGERITLQSYREVFRLAEGRRLYAFGELRISDFVPGGLSLRAIAYFLAAIGFIAALGALPVTEVLVEALPWQLRYLLLPGLCAALGSAAAPDGRSPHSFAFDLLSYVARSKRRVAGAAVPREGERHWLAAELFVVSDMALGRLAHTPTSRSEGARWYRRLRARLVRRDWLRR